MSDTQISRLIDEAVISVKKCGRGHGAIVIPKLAILVYNCVKCVVVLVCQDAKFSSDHRMKRLRNYQAAAVKRAAANSFPQASEKGVLYKPLLSWPISNQVGLYRRSSDG